MEKFKCGEPQKTYVSKRLNWFLWLVHYKIPEDPIIKVEVFKKRKDAYNFYRTLKGKIK